MTSTPTGRTPTERYLGALCRRAFLSLWSYPNLHTDEGRKGSQGVGNELCDLLVVFHNDVIIFSDKYVNFNSSIDVKVAWKRWYKKAVHRSAGQVFGAENWLRNYPDRVFFDAHCRRQFPPEMLPSRNMRVHRICVAHGAYEACKEHFGGESIGSLIVDSRIHGLENHVQPFRIGNAVPSKGFVHVFEDFTLDAVFAELDTISDFIAYLSKREFFLSREKPQIMAAGEEQLLSIYLTKMNDEGEHDFVLPVSAHSEKPDFVYFDESFWESMVANPQYKAKKLADRESYAWDNLIEHFIRHGGIYDEDGNRSQVPAQLEQGLRFVAGEPRIRRRQLANALLDLMKNARGDKRATRVVYSNDWPDQVYVFLILPVHGIPSYDEYRQARSGILQAYCKVAKLRFNDAKFVIGLATEPKGSVGTSEDLAVLDVQNWTPEMQEEAERIQRQASLLLDENVSVVEGRTNEYPPQKQIQHSDPSVRIVKKKTKSRRKMQKASRRKNRKK